MEIIPAIIPKNYDDLKEKVSQVKDFVSCIQVDITDGVFVLSESWPYTESVWSLEVLSKLPCSNVCNFEFDLMVQDPEKNINDFVVEGVKRIILHVESTDNLAEVIDLLKGRVEVGIAFNINTSFDLYEHLIRKADFVQLMGIEKIGYQGEPFTDKVFEKIEDLKKRIPGVIISVDGGVSLDNAKKFKEIGVDRIAIGSSIFKSENIEETVKEFKNITKK